MAKITEVGVASGVPNAGTGTAATLDGIFNRDAGPIIITTAAAVTAASLGLPFIQSPADNTRLNRAAIVVTIATTTETVIATAGAWFADIYGIIAANTSATATTLIIKDVTAGTTRAELNVPAGDTRGFMLSADSAIAQAATNTNWTGTLGTSVSGVVVTTLYIKN